MSYRCRIDSPIPFAHPAWCDVDTAKPLDPLYHPQAHGAHARDADMASFEHDDGAHTPKALSVAADAAQAWPRLLHVPIGQPSVPSPRPATPMVPPLSSHTPKHAHTCLALTIEAGQLDAMLQAAWQRVRPAGLPQHACMRLLRPDDDVLQYARLMREAQGARCLTPETFARLVAARLAHQHYTVVITHDDQLMATAALLVERKLTAGDDLIGHIDDIYLDPTWASPKLTQAMGDALATVGDAMGVAGYFMRFDWRA